MDHPDARLFEGVRFYAAELSRVLAPSGFAYVTAFVEDGVPDVEENPPGYLDELGTSSGPLHRVRYERGHLTTVLRDSGLRVDELRHRSVERTGQSVIIARPATAAPAPTR